MTGLVVDIVGFVASALQSNEAEGTKPKDGFKRLKINQSYGRTCYIEIPDCYDDVVHIANGSYGRVYKAIDKHEHSEMGVAIKQLVRPFENVQTAARGLKELLYLKNLDHENIVNLKHAFTADRCLENISDVYFVMELLSEDLRSVIGKRTLQKQFFSQHDLKSLSYQIFNALHHIHSFDIIHRDLKPSNIGMSPSGTLKIFDFGIARNTADQLYTYEVMVANYRAPEILLNWCDSRSNYSTKVDIWGAGCVIVEMAILSVLFKIPNIPSYFRIVSKIIGSPDDELKAKLCDDVRSHLTNSTLPDNEPPIGLRNILKVNEENDDYLLDLVKKLLHLDPDRRLCSLDVLQHKYFAALYNGVFIPMDVERLDCCDGVEDLPIEEVKRRMFEELTS